MAIMSNIYPAPVTLQPNRKFSINIDYHDFPKIPPSNNHHQAENWHNKPSGVLPNAVNPPVTTNFQEHTATFTYGQLCKSAVQVGLAGSSFALSNFGLNTPPDNRSLATAAGRWLIIAGALMESQQEHTKTKTPFLTKSDDYLSSDPSEKAFTSNLLGMTLAHLTCTSALPFTHLIHMDSVFTSNQIPLKGKRPDLLAISARAPFTAATVEAKGTHKSWNYNQALTAKNQARQLPKLGTLNYRYSIGSTSYFDRKSTWSSYLIDPPINMDEKDLNRLESMPVESLLQSYYDPFINLAEFLRGERVIPGNKLQIPIPGMPGLALSFPEELINAYSESRERRLKERKTGSTALQDLLSRTDDDLITVRQVDGFE